VRWSIDNATSTTKGWIVQKVSLVANVKDCSDNPVDTAVRGGWDPSWTPYWEGWEVRGGQVFVGSTTTPHNADTYGGPAVGDTTKGSISILGDADFYPNATLPSGMTPRNAAPAWALPYTRSDPGLTGGTGALSHNLTATWDCCTTTKTTTITTT
jgi:hypothetical protein